MAKGLDRLLQLLYLNLEKVMVQCTNCDYRGEMLMEKIPINKPRYCPVCETGICVKIEIDNK